MSDYHGTYSSDPDQPQSEITWQDQSCLVCGELDVEWTYRLRREPSAPSSFALPQRCYLCDACHALLQDGNYRALADRYRTGSGDWPAPEQFVLALRQAIDGTAVHR